MTTHDKFELPPLPEGFKTYEFPYGGYDDDEMRAYARAAVEADRKRRGEPVAWRIHPFDYGVGYEGAHALTSRPDQVVAWERKGWEVQPLYTAPQPALQSQDREDAERYRWLREQCQKPVGGLTITAVGTWELGPWSGDDPDEAIDHARRIDGNHD
jgi:hypothetical protein